jgi:hypothetical protein
VKHKKPYLKRINKNFRRAGAHYRASITENTYAKTTVKNEFTRETGNRALLLRRRALPFARFYSLRRAGYSSAKQKN